MSAPKIITTRHYSDEWSAVSDDYDGAPDSMSPMGWGKTENEAIADLQQQLEEHDE